MNIGLKQFKLGDDVEIVVFSDFGQNSENEIRAVNTSSVKSSAEATLATRFSVHLMFCLLVRIRGVCRPFRHGFVGVNFQYCFACLLFRTKGHVAKGHNSMKEQADVINLVEVFEDDIAY